MLSKRSLRDETLKNRCWIVFKLVHSTSMWLTASGILQNWHVGRSSPVSRCRQCRCPYTSTEVSVVTSALMTAWLPIKRQWGWNTYTLTAAGPNWNINWSVLKISIFNFFAINSSDKFHRWRHHSVCCLFSLWMHFCVFFPHSSTLCDWNLFAKISFHQFARWRHRYICCLYSFLDKFLCVFVAF